MRNRPSGRPSWKSRKTACLQRPAQEKFKLSPPGSEKRPGVDMQVDYSAVPGGVLSLTRTGTAPRVTELCQACSAAGKDLEHSPSTPELHLWTHSQAGTKFKGVGTKSFLQTRTGLPPVQSHRSLSRPPKCTLPSSQWDLGDGRSWKPEDCPQGLYCAFPACMEW